MSGPTDDARTTLAELERSQPKPTNAQALAALTAFWQLESADAARTAGVSGHLAAAYLMPLGILPRMRLLAFGWEKPGDTLRAATDAAWWKRQYTTSGLNPRKLWEPLGTYVDKVASDKVVSYNQDLADGDAAMLARERNAMLDELRAITAAHADICAPYLIPIRRGVVPSPEGVCMARIAQAGRADDAKKIIPRVPGLPWWALVGIVILVARELDKR